MDNEGNRAELFGKVLMILKDLYEHHEVFISLMPPFELSFEIDRDVLSQRLSETSISEETFEKQSSHIEGLLLANLRRKGDAYIKSRIERLELKDEKAEEEREKLRKELEDVRNTLWDHHLQARYELKTSSKAPSFTSIDWDIKLKIKDAKLKKIRFPYATCRIAFQRDFEVSPLTLLGGKAFDSTQINFSIDEVQYLIKVFTSIMRHLEEAETEGNK